MKIQDKLQACIDDPMWAAHAEINKSTLQVAVDTIKVLERDAARFRMIQRLSEEDEDNYTDEPGRLTAEAQVISSELDANYPDAKASDQLARLLDKLIEQFPEAS